MTDDAIVEQLVKVRGIGRWSAEMLLIFRLERPDVLPVHDFGVRYGFQLAYGICAEPSPRRPIWRAPARSGDRSARPRAGISGAPSTCTGARPPRRRRRPQGARRRRRRRVPPESGGRSRNSRSSYRCGPLAARRATTRAIRASSGAKARTSAMAPATTSGSRASRVAKRRARGRAEGEGGRGAHLGVGTHGLREATVPGREGGQGEPPVTRAARLELEAVEQPLGHEVLGDHATPPRLVGHRQGPRRGDRGERRLDGTPDISRSRQSGGSAGSEASHRARWRPKRYPHWRERP